MTTSLRLPLIALALAACNHDSSVGSDTDGGVMDATAAGTCANGNDRLVMTGAYTIDTTAAATVTRDGIVIGLAGQVAGNVYALGVRDALTQDLGTVGAFDVATTNLKHLEIPPGADCDVAPAGTCKGFFALSGTFVVESVSPRYRATFTLGDLRERTTNGNTLGAPIAGTATGCLDVEP